MDDASRGHTWRDRSPRAPVVQFVLFAAGIYVLSVTAVSFRPVGATTSLWWPAAALAVAGMIRAPARLRPAVFGIVAVVSGLANVAGGQDPLVAALFGLANATEALVVLRILQGRDGRIPGMASFEELGRVLLAIAVGALVMGLLAGLVVATLLGGSLTVTALNVAAAHGSAILLVAPLLLQHAPRVREAEAAEQLLQWLIVVAATLAVFSPGQRLPIVFLLPPTLLFAALRSPPAVVAGQLFVSGLLASIATQLGWGPFAAAVDTVVQQPIHTVRLVQLYVLASGVLILAVLSVVEERRASLADLVEREELFRGGFSDALLGMLLLRVEEGDLLRIVALNGPAARLLGGEIGHLEGVSLGEVLRDDAREALRHAVAELLGGERAGWHGEFELVTETGHRWVEVALSPSTIHEGDAPVLTAQMVDITARREAEARLTELALRDGLTGLANRLLLAERMELGLASCRRDGGEVAVVFIDLDGFKAVNDAAGHEVGDRLLVALGTRLKQQVRAVDTVARLGGDEFVILLPGIDDRGDVARTVERLLTALRQPLPIGDAVFQVGASAGIAIGGPEADAGALLRDADNAMYAAKRAAKGYAWADGELIVGAP